MLDAKQIPKNVSVLHINKNNVIQNTESIKQERISEEELWKNQEIVDEPNKNERIKIKKENVKVEIELKPFEVVEIQEIPNIKTDDKKEDTCDPFKLNEGKLNNCKYGHKQMQIQIHKQRWSLTL